MAGQRTTRNLRRLTGLRQLLHTKETCQLAHYRLPLNPGLERRYRCVSEARWSRKAQSHCVAESFRFLSYVLSKGRSKNGALGRRQSKVARNAPTPRAHHGTHGSGCGSRVILAPAPYASGPSHLSSTGQAQASYPTSPHADLLVCKASHGLSFGAENLRYSGCFDWQRFDTVFHGRCFLICFFSCWVCACRSISGGLHGSSWAYIHARF